MTALSILDIKEFMNILLRTDTFDNFLLSEASITTCITYLLDGHAKIDFFHSDEEAYSMVSQEEYIPFALVRTACFDLIKGKRTPSSFKFVFRLSKENQQHILTSIGSTFSLEDISGMYLNLKYQNKQLICTTGISYRIFSMDKSLEYAWEDRIKLFFKKHKIAVEALIL